MTRRKNRGEDRFSKRSRRRVRKRHLIGTVGIALTLVLLVVLPKIATHPALLNPLVNRFAGVAPLSVQIENAKAGWFSPVEVEGIQIRDEQGTVLAQVRSVRTEKGIIGWATNSADLGTIQITGAETTVIAGKGTTNLERAFAPLLPSEEQPTNAEATPESTQVTGTIQVKDSAIMLREQGRAEQWLVTIPQVSLPLDSLAVGTQVASANPIELQMAIAEVSGQRPEASGGIAADVRLQAPQQSAAAAMVVRAKAENVPVAFWHVVKARFPELPIEEIDGEISAAIAGNLVDSTNWTMAIQDLELNQILVADRQMIGAQPAKIEKVAGQFQCSATGNRLQIDQVDLHCDFASIKGAGATPWPLPVPSINNPLLGDSQLQLTGNVDLPKLVMVAGDLLPMRPDTQLLSGNVMMDVRHQVDTTGAASASVAIQLQDLRATSAGQSLQWEQPLILQLSANEQAGHIQYAAKANADFLDLRAGGTVESGLVQGEINLDRLQNQLSQWVELPIENMRGAANVDINWSLDGQNAVVAQGTLNTSEMTIALNNGNAIEEPAWQGELQARVGVENGTPVQLVSAGVKMRSAAESIEMLLLEPLSLVEGASVKPAGFSLDLQGDLNKWNHRGTVWLEEPTGVDVNGNIQLAVNGNLDLQHVEITSANWNSQPLQVTSAGWNFAEPQMVGKFEGFVDSNDFTRLVVDVLQVQSTSFSMGAKDSAADQGGRIGQAVFRLDLGQLMRNVGASGAQVPQGQTQYLASGILNGQMAWQITGSAAGVNAQVTTDTLNVVSASPGQAASTLWAEPNATLAVQGTWQAENNHVEVQNLQFEAPWASYRGTATYQAEESGQSFAMNGQATYDCGLLTQKLYPFTGGQFAMIGRQQSPVQLQWNDGGPTMLSGLNATTRVGWQEANAAGIGIGQATVPISVDAGVVHTASMVPVSGGALRWDMSADLTADELVIRQKPMTVLENVAITKEMCQGWLKYVAPILAEATSVDGRLSLQLDRGEFYPTNTLKQTAIGRVSIHNGTVGPGPLSNQVIALTKQVEAIRKKDFTQAVSSTQRVWMNLPEQQVDFEMVNGNVIHRNLGVEIGDASISTAGSVALDGRMQMVASMPIPDDWADKSTVLVGLKGQTLQFPVVGTLTNPQVDTQLLTQLGRQTVQNAASGLLQQGLNKGLEKLLGPNGAPQPTAPNSGVDPLKGIGQQILGGQGINLPGIIPGLNGQNGGGSQ